MTKKYWELIENNDWEGETWTTLFIVDNDEYNDLMNTLSKEINKFEDGPYELNELTRKQANSIEKLAELEDDFGYMPEFMVDEAPPIEKWKELKLSMENTENGDDEFEAMDLALYKMRIFSGE